MSHSSTSNSEGAAATDGLIPLLDERSLAPRDRVGLGIAVAVFLLVIGGTFAADTFFPAAAARAAGEEGRRRDIERREARTLSGFRTGAWGRSFEEDLKDRSRLRSLALPYAAYGLFAYFGETNGLAVVGNGGRAYLTDRIAPAAGMDDEVLRRAARRIAAVDRRFRAIGTKLLLLPIPRKAAVEHELLPQGADPEPDLESRFVRALETEGVRTADLTEIYFRSKDFVYWPIDSHWNDLGAEIAAEIAAEKIGARVLPEARLTDVRDTEPRREPADLLRSVGITDPRLVDRLTRRIPRKDLFIRGQATPAPSPAVPEPTPITVIGTSFTATSNFLRFLTHATNQLIYDGSERGAGPVRPLERIANLIALGKTRPADLIWELPDHYVFSAKDPLADADIMIASLPDDGLRPLADFLEDGSETWSKFFGPMTITPKASFNRKIGARRILFSGDGVVCLSIRATITGSDAIVRVIAGGGTRTIPVKAGRIRIVLPLVADGVIADPSIEIKPLKGEAVLTDFDAALMTDIERGGTRTRAEKIPARAAAVFHGKLPEKGTVRAFVRTLNGDEEIEGELASGEFIVVLGVNRLSGAVIKDADITAASEITRRTATLHAPKPE